MTQQRQQEVERHGRDYDDIEHVNLPDQAKAHELSAETDDLLDEIDGLLEENAEMFVEQFIQKGGQ